jgi:hypothetical protein
LRPGRADCTRRAVGAVLAWRTVAQFEHLAVNRRELLDRTVRNFGNSRAGLGGDELAVALPLAFVARDDLAESLVERLIQTCVGLGRRIRGGS